MFPGLSLPEIEISHATNREYYWIKIRSQWKIARCYEKYTKYGKLSVILRTLEKSGSKTYRSTNMPKTIKIYGPISVKKDDT